MGKETYWKLEKKGEGFKGTSQKMREQADWGKYVKAARHCQTLTQDHKSRFWNPPSFPGTGNPTCAKRATCFSWLLSYHLSKTSGNKSLSPNSSKNILSELHVLDVSPCSGLISLLWSGVYCAVMHPPEEPGVGVNSAHAHKDIMRSSDLPKKTIACVTT